MTKKDTPIKRKLLRVIMLTCEAVLLITCAAFFIYEFITYKEITRTELVTLGKITAANSSTSFAFGDKKNADKILGTLNIQKHLVAACLYNKDGNIFAAYPKNISHTYFPATVQKGYVFRNNYLEGFEPVIEGNNRLGTLYVKSDMKAVYNRFSLYGIVAGVFIILSFFFAYLLSRRLQRSISMPILELAEIAGNISEKKDYSVRAEKRNNDEIGALTDAFNQMLNQIETQNAKINALNANLEEKVALRTSELSGANHILKQQNELIETIIDSSIDLIAVFNRDLEYVILNNQANNIYQVNREDLIGKNIYDVFPKLKGSLWAESLQKAFEGHSIHQQEYKSLVSDRQFENFFIPLKDKDGITDRVMVIGHDITSIMQANEKLKEVNADLEKSNRDLEQFAYVASHDLQEPLRKIQTFSELSEKNLQYPVILKRYLQKINLSAKRMAELITAVLNYSRLSKGDSEFTQVDLNTILDNIKTDLELLIEEKNAVITNNRLPVIKGIPLQMNQLFLNLISNSLKFSKDPPVINVSAEIMDYQQLKKTVNLEKEGEYAVLCFSDNGIGFEQEYAEQIFSIFQRLHLGGGYTGTGIGLALCKKIVENHDGIIIAESEKEKGSKFFVYLPLKQNNGVFEKSNLAQQLKNY